jgi:hypothetical protein
MKRAKLAVTKKIKKTDLKEKISTKKIETVDENSIKNDFASSTKANLSPKKMKSVAVQKATPSPKSYKPTLKKNIKKENYTPVVSLQPEPQKPISTNFTEAKKADSNYKFTFPKISFNPIKTIRIWAFNFQNNFLQNQATRVAAAILLTILVVGGFIYFSRNDSLNFSKKDPEQVSTNALTESPEFQKNLNKLRNINSALTPESIVYDRIKYQDLPVYPEGWVERNFTATELRNSLVSGPSADPDSDGLNNKAEFLYGSDPKNKYSLCGTNNGEAKCQKTDKENVDALISPLTGFAIEDNQDILVSKQNQVFLKSVQESFEASSKEGVDFTILYQESKLIDLSSELDQDSFVVVPDTRSSFTDYIDTRVNILDALLTEDETDNQLGSLLSVYKTSKVEDLKQIYDKYDKLNQDLLKVGVPETYKGSHKALLMLFRKLKTLVKHRQVGFENQTTSSADYLAKSKKLAVEVVWSYRRMDNELQKLSKN